MKITGNSTASFLDMKLQLNNSKQTFSAGTNTAKDSLCSVPINYSGNSKKLNSLMENKSETDLIESNQNENHFKAKGHSSYLMFKRSLKREDVQSKSSLTSQTIVQLNPDKLPVYQNTENTESTFSNRSKSAQVLRPRRVSFSLVDNVVEVDNWKHHNKVIDAPARISAKKIDKMCILF